MKTLLKVIFIILFLPLVIAYYIFKWAFIFFRKKTRTVLLPDVSYADNLSGEEFELFLYQVFENLGYKVETTSVTGDYGVDLILFNGKTKTIVQAKRYSANVGVEAIQEIFSARNIYSADHCVVVTNSYFTKNATILAKSNNVELIDRDGLIQLINKKKKIVKGDTRIQSETNNVPLSDDELIKKVLEIIDKEQQISTSLIQRRLRLSYTKSSQILEKMKQLGLLNDIN